MTDWFAPGVIAGLCLLALPVLLAVRLAWNLRACAAGTHPHISGGAE